MKERIAMQEDKMESERSQQNSKAMYKIFHMSTKKEEKDVPVKGELTCVRISDNIHTIDA